MRKGRVCLIENDPDIIDVISDVLTTEGFEPVLFKSANEFLKAIDSIEELDYIFSDHIMPGLTGGELCQKLQTFEKFKDIPFILMSARKIAPAQLQTFPTFHFLQKPFSLNNFLKLIKKL